MYIFAEVPALILDPYCFRKGKKVQCRACNTHNIINSSKIIKVIFGSYFGAPKK